MPESLRPPGFFEEMINETRMPPGKSKEAWQAVQAIGLTESPNARIVFNIGGANPMMNHMGVLDGMTYNGTGDSAEALKQEALRLYQAGGLDAHQQSEALTLFVYLEKHYHLQAVAKSAVERDTGKNVVVLDDALMDKIVAHSSQPRGLRAILDRVGDAVGGEVVRVTANKQWAAWQAAKALGFEKNEDARTLFNVERNNPLVGGNSFGNEMFFLKERRAKVFHAEVLRLKEGGLSAELQPQADLLLSYLEEIFHVKPKANLEAGAAPKSSMVEVAAAAGKKGGIER